MKKLILLLALVGGMSLSTTGCMNPGASYVDADRKTQTAVAPRLSAYLDTHKKPDGSALSADDEASARDTLTSWDLRITAAEQQNAKPAASTAPVVSPSAAK